MWTGRRGEGAARRGEALGQSERGGSASATELTLGRAI